MMETHALRFVFVLALFLLAAGQIAAQTPAEITDQMIKLTAATQQAETRVAAAMEKADYDRKTVQADVATSQQNVRQLRQLLDDLDNQYDKLNDTQRGAVREAWDVIMILSTYVEGQLKPPAKDDIVIPGLSEKSMLDDSRTTAVCAARRAEMLGEVLGKLKKG